MLFIHSKHKKWQHRKNHYECGCTCSSAVLHKKNIGKPTTRAMENKSTAFSKVKHYLVFTVLKSLGIGTYAIKSPFHLIFILMELKTLLLVSLFLNRVKQSRTVYYTSPYCPIISASVAMDWTNTA